MGSILEDDVQLDTKKWAHVSPEAKHLVKRLLSRNPNRRATIDDILEFTSKFNKSGLKRNRSRSNLLRTKSLESKVEEREMCLSPSIIRNVPRTRYLPQQTFGSKNGHPVKKFGAVRKKKRGKLKTTNVPLKDFSIDENDLSDLRYNHRHDKETLLSSENITCPPQSKAPRGMQWAPREFITRSDRKK